MTNYLVKIKKKTMRNILIIISVLFLLSCSKRSTSVIQTTETVKIDSTSKKDSVSERITVKFDTLYIKDSIKSYITIDCDTTGKLKPNQVLSYQESGNNKQTVKTDEKGNLVVETNCGRLERIIEKWKQDYYKLESEYKNKQDSKVSKTEEKKHTIKYRIPKWILYVLSASLLLNLWYNRKYILKLFKLIINLIV